MISKKISVPVITLSLVAMTLLAAPPVYAQDITGGQQNFFFSIFHKILRKFGFEKAVTTQTADTQPSDQNGDRTPPNGTPPSQPNGTPGADQKNKQTDEERLIQLVKNGKITEAQKTTILAELKAVRAKYMPTPSTTPDPSVTPDPSKRTAISENMKLMNEELTAWAKAQGIDIQYVISQSQGNGQQPGGQPGQGNGGPQGMKKPEGSPKPTPTVTE